MSDAIRPYEPRDAEGVRRCIAALQAYERTLEAVRAEATPELVEGMLQRMLAACRVPRAACRVVLVAEADGVVAGFVCCFMMTITNPITTLSDCAYVADVAVLEPYRRRGLGRAQLRARPPIMAAEA